MRMAAPSLVSIPSCLYMVVDFRASSLGFHTILFFFGGVGFIDGITFFRFDSTSNFTGAAESVLDKCLVNFSN